ncbi:MAG TPA: hypothetical protein DCY64_22630 [Hydrogenophaga sp.]|uniref:terminase gpP N-terminus-related DNA-binding protein n=1 Tax=Hydrogenophaga sp. TaxID=1904254 RepID=UPI000E93AEC4|nr:hypothetical protein [Hydrogenophaga sp.]HBU17068.1 hypothetical protein [Hydrogenophaga sp.]
MATPLVAVNERGRLIGQDHPNTRHTDREIGMARRLKAEGWSLKRIADAMDTKKSTVASWLSGRRRNQTPSEWKYGRK